MKKKNPKKPHQKGVKHSDTARSLKVPKKQQQLYKSINGIFGAMAFIVFCYSCYVGYGLMAFDLEDGSHERMLNSFIHSLYYPIFYLIGIVLSRRAFFAKRFKMAIWMAFLIPLMPVLLLSVSWNS